MKLITFRVKAVASLTQGRTSSFEARFDDRGGRTSSGSTGEAPQRGPSDVARTPGVHHANQMPRPKLGAFAK